jgi:hypothetical protein
VLEFSGDDQPTFSAGGGYNIVETVHRQPRQPAAFRLRNGVQRDKTGEKFVANSAVRPTLLL